MNILTDMKRDQPSNAWYLSSLICPHCSAALDLSKPCQRCGFTPPPGQPLDLRPQKSITRELRLPIGTSAPADLQKCVIERPTVTYSGPRAERDSAELFSAVAESLLAGDRLLDLGCGWRDQAPVAAHYGLRYAGVDYSSPGAEILADAHALPFHDASFDHVLSYAVFEHLHTPHLAATEVARVLTPGGLFFGAVSQGEPFHESYFHHTALGLLSLLHATGFRVRRLWSSYDTLHALATMGRYPRAIRVLIGILHRFTRATPFLAPRAFLGSSRREKELEEIYRTAAICFVAERVSVQQHPPSVTGT